MKLTNAIEEFFNDNNYSEKTKISYKANIIKFVNVVFQEYEKDAKTEMFNHVDGDIILLYKECFTNNSSYNQFLSVIRQFISFLYKRGLIVSDIRYLDSLKTLEPQPASTEALDKEDVVMFISDIGKEKKGYIKQLALLTAVETGIRMEDLLNLTENNFIEVDGEVFMCDYSKYKETEYMKISHELYGHLTHLNNKDGGKMFRDLSIKVITSMITRSKIRLQKEKEKISYTSFTKTHKLMENGEELDLGYIYKNILNEGVLI